MFKEQMFDTGEAIIHYAEGPPNGPPLVMLHGITIRVGSSVFRATLSETLLLWLVQIRVCLPRQAMSSPYEPEYVISRH